MRSKWIEYKGKKIFYGDFSNLLFRAEALEQENNEVMAVILQQPKNSVRVLSNFANTELNSKLISMINESVKVGKEHIYKTALLGVTGFKRTVGDMVSRIAGAPFKYFDREEDALEWLVKDWNE